MNFQEIIESINKQSNYYRFGQLQQIRKTRRPFKKIAAKYPFRDVHDDWAHHLGGRKELQFNVGRYNRKWCLSSIRYAAFCVDGG